jgi:hypothetical protein
LILAVADLVGDRVASMRRACVLFALVALVALLGGCEKPSHDNVEKWRNSQKGVAKLTATLRNASLDADLRAHAAEALIWCNDVQQVVDLVSAMPAAERDAFFAKFTPRLWSVAKSNDADVAPTSHQVRAKDALFQLRPLAEGPRRDEIDDDLVDWLTAGSFYAQRAATGDQPGNRIIRAIGKRAGPKMTQLGRDLYGQLDKGAQGIQPIDSHTLEAIAWTGAPEAISFLIDLAEKEQKQEGLQVQALTAIYTVYIDNTEAGPKPDLEGLAPNLKRLQAIASDPDQPGENVNVAFELINAVGPPRCLQPLVYLATHRDFILRLRAVDFAMRCGGADAIVPVAEALPDDNDAEYKQSIIRKYIVQKIGSDMRAGALEAARILLSSRRWLARFIGIEILDEYGTKADAKLVRALARDKQVLHGFWDDPRPGEAKKKDPTLGQRATEVADLLEKKS